MHTNNVPRSNDHSSCAGIVSDSDKLPVKIIAVPDLFINRRLLKPEIQKTKENAISFTVISLFMIAMLYCTFQNRALGENKLSDGLALSEIQEKKYSFYFDKDRQQLQVNGIMEIGILPAFENMLSRHPESTEVAFNSNGGNIYQARGLAKIIISKALNTYVSEDCYSACTIAYMAGNIRQMGPDGRLGFHQYNMKYKLLNQRFDVGKEQAKDITFFKSRISDVIFIEKIFSSKNSDLWIPEHNDLLKSGVIHEIVPESDR